MPMYKAIKRGFDGVKSREIGEVFEFAGKPSKWMEIVKEEESQEPKPQGKEKPKLKSKEEDVI